MMSLSIILPINIRKHRQKDRTLRAIDYFKYRIQLCLSLLLMLVVALVLVALSAEEIPPYYEGCVTVSVLVHYFTLVSVLFMAAEAILVFRKTITPLKLITTKYHIIAFTICWCM